MTRKWCILYLLMFLCVSEREALRRAVSGIVKSGKADSRSAKAGKNASPKNGLLSGWVCLSRLKRPIPRERVRRALGEARAAAGTDARTFNGGTAAECYP